MTMKIFYGSTAYTPGELAAHISQAEAHGSDDPRLPGMRASLAMANSLPERSAPIAKTPTSKPPSGPTHFFEGTRGRATSHTPAHAPVASAPKAKDFSIMAASVEATNAHTAGKKRPLAKKRSSLSDVMDKIQQRKR